MKKIILKIFVIVLFVILLRGYFENTSKAMGKYVVLIGEDSNVIDKIANIDVLIIDAEYFSKDEISHLKKHGVNEIYSYLNIGSIENFRSYYAEYEDYTLGEYENWPEEKWIDVSNPKWQEYVASRVSNLVQKGVDGFFIDNVDVYYMYQKESIYDGIINILQDIKNFDKKVIINGGDIFVKKYLEKGKNKLIDGVNQENVYTMYDFSNDSYSENAKDTREYYTNYLDLVIQHGCTAYALEYATNSVIQREAEKYAKAHGYICYVSDNIELKSEK